MSTSDPANPKPIATPQPKTLQRVALERAHQALRLVPADLPHLSGLSRLVRLKVTRRTAVASIAASGLMLVNPDVFAYIPRLDAAFIMAHELMHLALDTHGRQGNSPPLLVNFAHDYIINDMLAEDTGREPPLGGLFQSGMREKSLEELVGQMQKEGIAQEVASWRPGAGRGKKPGQSPANSPITRALQEAGLVPKEQRERLDPGLARGDMIPSDREDEFEPEIAPGLRQRLREQVRRAAAKASSLGALRKKMADANQNPSEPARGEALMRAIRKAYDTPWERALQRWIDAVAPGERTYMRPARRRHHQSDVVLPGRRRDGWMLHILLDTSGSMVDILPRALGAIAYFAENAGVTEVHLVQCDIEVTHDDWIDPDKLAEYSVRGFGYSEMAPGMNYLAQDPEVRSVLVLTDGYISYPSAEPPFNVLWVLIGDLDRDFKPLYGNVVIMELD
jgi:predicted metal-dependent peptidase